MQGDLGETLGDVGEGLMRPAVDYQIPIGDQEHWGSAALKKAANIGLSVPEFFTSPAGIATVGTGGVFPLLTKLGFTGLMAKDLVQQGAETIKDWHQMTPSQQAQAVVGMVGTGAMMAGSGMGAKADIQSRFPTMDPYGRPATAAADALRTPEVTTTRFSPPPEEAPIGPLESADPTWDLRNMAARRRAAAVEGGEPAPLEADPSFDVRKLTPLAAEAAPGKPTADPELPATQAAQASEEHLTGQPVKTSNVPAPSSPTEPTAEPPPPGTEVKEQGGSGGEAAPEAKPMGYTVIKDGEPAGFFSSQGVAEHEAKKLGGNVRVVPKFPGEVSGAKVGQAIFQQQSDAGKFDQPPTPVVEKPETSLEAPPDPPVVTGLDPNKHTEADVPVADIHLSEDVPNFKEGADPSTGIVPGQELGGKLDQVGFPPIVLWRRADGRLEVITGRHRLELARRTGEKTIKSHIMDEASGFTKDMALRLDAWSNIKDGQGTVEDYAHYFKHDTQLTREQAEAAGLLSRVKGRTGWKLGRDASDDLYAGRIEEAVKAYRALYAAKSDDPGVAEARLNRLGYDFLGNKEYSKAIAILKLNTELYAASSNTYDSLAEAYLASGDRVRALEMYRAVLKVLPKDDKADPATKEQLRRNAEAKISELSRRLP